MTVDPPAAAPEPLVVDLERPRNLGQLLGACLLLYQRWFWLFAALAFAVVVPVTLITDGVAEGQLIGGYDPSPPLGAAAASVLANILVTTPLVTAMHVQAVMTIGSGAAPSIRASLLGGLELFWPLLGAVALASLGELAGFAALIVPGLYLLTRWYFVAQTVIVEGCRGAGALRSSGALVEGSWWRVFGIVLLVQLLAGAGAAVFAVPLELAADAADSGPLALLGTILGNGLALSFTALAGTMLYFDLRTRRELAGHEGYRRAPSGEEPEAPIAGFDPPTPGGG